MMISIMIIRTILNGTIVLRRHQGCSNDHLFGADYVFQLLLARVVVIEVQLLGEAIFDDVKFESTQVRVLKNRGN